ncbi:MAG: UDP-2,3-diacylglucosamine diphosphatase LpxI [Planctomycetota bacterium]
MDENNGYHPFRTPLWERLRPTASIGDSDAENQSPIGLIAGWGRFPVQVAHAVVASGRPVVCVAITGHADRQLEYICDDVQWMGVGKLGGHQRYFRQFDVHTVTMAGKLFKSQLLFRGSVLLRHLPDWMCIKTLAPLLLGKKRDTRDDVLLTAVTNAYQNNGMNVKPATELAPQLLIDDGLLTHRPPSQRQQNDAEYGWRIAKQMGQMDIGQSIAVSDGTVIAVEAIEGTDACIQRAGKLCPRGGWTLIKTAKPQQDMRFDVPTIGTQTVDNVADGGGTCIVIESHRTIVVDREATIRRADHRGVAILAIRDGAMKNQNNEHPSAVSRLRAVA